jgi:hypothetical protein
MRIFIISCFAWICLFANQIEVAIVYGADRPVKKITAEYENGISALELLSKVAKIRTSETGKYTFVRSIDSKRLVKGSYGWFYMIDGKEMDTMSSGYKLQNNKSMTWIYKVEECY